MEHSSSRIVTVKVVEVKPSGIRVTLSEGGKGFIRPREVSWDRRVSIPLELPRAGDDIRAILLEEKRGIDRLLSIRQITDPWKEAFGHRKYKVGQIVEGEVVNLRHDRIHIQLEPGVDGVIFPKYVPLLRGQSLDEVLWLGDKVSAKIIGVDEEKKEYHLGLVQRLMEFPKDLEPRHNFLLDYFGAEHHPRMISAIEEPSEQDATAEKRFIEPILEKLERVLLVDDEVEWQNVLGDGLTNELMILVDTATTGEEAINKFKAISYNLVAIDVKLTGESGIDVAHAVRELNAKTPILLMIAYNLDEDHLPLDGRDFPFCQKGVEDLIYKIDELLNGYWQSKSSESSQKTWGADFIHRLGMETFAKRPLEEIYSEILATLYMHSGVSQCLLVQLERTQKTGSILASHPPLSQIDRERAQDGIYFSPVRQVVEEEVEFLDNSVNFDDKKYKNFFPNQNFQSCFGIPIRLNDRTTQFALFLLDEEYLRFDEGDEDGEKRILYARTTGYLLSVAIERAFMLESMRRYEEHFALGYLNKDFVHEINNKMMTLRNLVNNLKNNYANFCINTDNQKKVELQGRVDKQLDILSSFHSELGELVASYLRLSKNEFESTDVKTVVTEVLQELKRTTEIKDIKIVLDYEEKIPSVKAIPAQLKQILLNLVLNSIYMIALQREWATVANQQSHLLNAAPFQNGIIIIQIRYAGENSIRPIEIRVIDNGPGIHWRDQSRIFEPGISRRGGSGLGLNISRNLAERMGGRLYISDSVLYLGSAFILELSSFNTSGEPK